MRWLGFDIGGANLKVADGLGYADSSAFPLWKDPTRLVPVLRSAIDRAPVCDHLAVTMTGELADCFETKQDGVVFILRAMQAAAGDRPIQVYLNNGTLVCPETAFREPLDAAATNWHALASYAGRYTEQGAALLIDVGSTTCDIVSIDHGRPVGCGGDDLQRFLSGELLYTGVKRSPVCALLQTVRYRGRECPIAQEWFATSQDVYLVLGDLPADADDRDTADGRPATAAAARARLARHISASAEQFDEVDAFEMARQVAEQQQEMLSRSIQVVTTRLPRAPDAVIVSGLGEFLARQALAKQGVAGTIISIETELGWQISQAAPAHALAVLAREASLV